jgi:argininosuccinate lyase
MSLENLIINLEYSYLIDLLRDKEIQEKDIADIVNKLKQLPKERLQFELKETDEEIILIEKALNIYNNIKEKLESEE